MSDEPPRLSPFRDLFAGSAPDDVAERVCAIIRRQEALSEILIGWVQLVIVTLFGTLYALSPTAHGAFMPQFEPVPFVLAAYFAFTVFRLCLAYRGALPASVVYLSVFLDMALLMGLIYSFHIQYDQPAAFYLKAPTLLYVFIFIALRALRFDPRYVLTAGLAAAAGWLILVLLAAAEMDPDAYITRDFVAYMTSNRMLIGAEIDKIVSILLVTMILTAALSRGRRLLITAARESEAARDLGRFFSPEVARAITAAQVRVRAGQGEAREAGVLLVDIRGFTRFSATISPDEVVRLLADYQTFMVPAIERHGGTIDKFLGDGIMATFGAVSPGTVIAADVVAAVEDVLDQAAAWNAFRAAAGDHRALTVNAAATLGPVVFGAVGHADRLEYTVIGATVNGAAKLEEHNKRCRSRALVPAQLYRRALAEGFRPRLTWQAIDGQEVPGLDGDGHLMMVPGAAVGTGAATTTAAAAPARS